MRHFRPDIDSGANEVLRLMVRALKSGMMEGGLARAGDEGLPRLVICKT